MRAAAMVLMLMLAGAGTATAGPFDKGTDGTSHEICANQLTDADRRDDPIFRGCGRWMWENPEVHSPWKTEQN